MWFHWSRSVEDPQGAQICFHYDAAGRLSHAIDCSGRPIVFVHDQRGRPDAVEKRILPLEGHGAPGRRVGGNRRRATRSADDDADDCVACAVVSSAYEPSAW